MASATGLPWRWPDWGQISLHTVVPYSMLKSSWLRVPLGVQVVPIAAELSNLNEVEAMLSDLVHRVPQIDIVFNNAAVSPPCPSGFWSASDQDHLLSFTVNTIAPIRIC